LKKISNMLLLLVLTVALADCKPSTERASESASDTDAATLMQPAATDEAADAGERSKWMEIPKTLRGDKGVILNRVGYTTSYNAQNKIPNWVAWRLTSNHVKGRYGRDFMEFHEDESVRAPRADDNDYYNSGYDRGHMCPSGDNKWSKEAQEESFLFTNICPQRHGLNAGAWNDVEMQCRDWAKRYGTLYIVCGPVFYHQEHRTIGRHRVAVPDAFYKVILRKENAGYKAIGFVYENRSAKRDMSRYVRSIDEIEELTGLDFFSALPDDVEDAIESRSNLRDWYPLMELRSDSR
jgi:endonuclease G